jgi:anthranilate phosphoribosyltransferase
MAQALAQLGLRRAVVVHGCGGLDEASLEGPNALRLLDQGRIRSESLDPAALDLEVAPNEALRGGDVANNAAILEAVLRGGGSRPQRDVVILNTALVLWVAEAAPSIAAAVPQVRESLGAGEPWRRLEALRNRLGPVAAG